MSNKNQSKEQEPSNKVKAVRLYKIGSYQPENNNDNNVNYVPRYNNRRVQFTDPRDFYFNPYQFGPYMPPGNFNPNFPPISDFSYQRRRNNKPPHAINNLRNPYYNQGSNYYNNWNDYAPYSGSSGYYLNQYEEEEDEEDDENDGDDEDTDQNTAEDEEEQDDDNDDDDDDSEDDEDADSDEDENQLQKVELKKESEQTKNEDQPRKLSTTKVVETKKENEPILKKIIDSASTPPITQRKLSLVSATHTSYLPSTTVESLPPLVQSAQQQQQPKSILATETTSKQQEETRPKTSQHPVIRMMPIKPTTKKVVKITTAEVVDAPYKVEKPMSPDSKAKFLRKSSIDSAKSNEDVNNISKTEIKDEILNKTPVTEKLEEEILNNSSLVEKIEDEILNKTPVTEKSEEISNNSSLVEKIENEDIKQEIPIETSNSLVENRDQQESVNLLEEIKANGEITFEYPKETLEDETSAKNDLIQDDQIDETPPTSIIQEEPYEESMNLYEKSFRINDVEVLPTITEIVPLRKEKSDDRLEKKAKNKTKKSKHNSKKYEAPKPVIKAINNNQVSAVKQSNEKLSKRSIAISNLKHEKASSPVVISTSKVDKTVEKLHDFIEANHSKSKLDEEKTDVESTKSSNSISEDNLFMIERENSTFFGKISKVEVPALVSTSITPAPLTANEKDMFSDTEQRINEIVEENRSDFLFKPLDAQFYREEITELMPKLRVNENKTKKLRKKKTTPGLPNKFSSQFLLKRAYSDLNKSNLPALSHSEDKSRELKLKQEEDDYKNELKFPSLIMSEKLEDYKSFGAAHHLNCRKYLDPGFKRCPCLMHNRLYYEDITNKIAPDVESYEMRPYSVKESDYHGERHASLNKLKSVNEALPSENEFSSQSGEYEINYSRTNSHLISDKHNKREPWNNVF